MFEIAGKIYVVVAVIAIILLGLIAFMFYLEHRIRSAERKLDMIEKKDADSKLKGI